MNYNKNLEIFITNKWIKNYLDKFFKPYPDFLKSLFPLITRIAAKTMSSTLVSVKSMEMPSGSINHIDFKFKDPDTTPEEKALKKKLETFYY
jgi:hypothetical protein